MPIKIQNIDVTDLNGQAHPAQLLQCEQCDGIAWLVFVLDGQAHSHFGCVGCKTSYCPDGLCALEGT